MARTYVPTLRALVLRLHRYVQRYDVTIEQNLSGELEGAYQSFKGTLATLAELFEQSS